MTYIKLYVTNKPAWSRSKGGAVIIASDGNHHNLALAACFRFYCTVLLLAAIASAASGQQQKRLQPPAAVQSPFNAMKVSARFKIGKNADWVAVTADAVWVAGTSPYSILRIDPKTNVVAAKIELPGEACSGLATGFHSVWIPLCGKPNSLARLDKRTNKLVILPIGPAGEGGGIATSVDSVWLVSDDNGTLNRIDPRTNLVRQKISILPGSYNPIHSKGKIWVTSVKSNSVTAVDASTGAVIKTIPVGPQPRFLTAGGGSIWTLNQGDGTVTRVDESKLNVAATVPARIPGHGGDITYGYGSIWATVFGTPLTRIDAKSNKLLRQWTGAGGDSLRIGFASIWITDYRNGLRLRIPLTQAMHAGRRRSVRR